MFIPVTSFHINHSFRKKLMVNLGQVTHVEAHSETGGTTMFFDHRAPILTVESLDDLRLPRWVADVFGAPATAPAPEFSGGPAPDPNAPDAPPAEPAAAEAQPTAKKGKTEAKAAAAPEAATGTGAGG